MLELGLLGLFIASFLSATLIPASSELVMVSLYFSGIEPLHLLLVATLGNSIGGFSGYLLGRYGLISLLEKYFSFSNNQFPGVLKVVRSYPLTSAFFCWLPIIGDFISIILGVVKAKPISVLLLMTLGKALRYGLILLATHKGWQWFNF